MPDSPTIAEIAGLLGSMLFISVIVVLVLISAFRGSDLRGFDAMRASNPKHFGNLVWVCRINCVLILFAMPFGFAMPVLLLSRESEGPVWFRVLLALWCVAVFLPFTWLTFRWVRWGWQTRLT
jgi:hypothetical protein